MESGDRELIDTRLYDDVREVLQLARSKTYSAVNYAMVEAYWNIGKLIFDTIGTDGRSESGKQLMKYLSDRLTIDFGKGFDESNLRYMRKFYLTFPNLNALRHELSWTHYRMILRDEIIGKEPGQTPLDIVKDPYVLEFLGLRQNNDLYEAQLEQALVTHIQKFLLELGRGFTFEARQKLISFDGEHYYIDLVFYNYLLRCFVLIDLKTGRLTHQDLGQMQMYVNYYTREMMNDGDNPPIGILLCADESESVVKYTLPEDNTQIFASKYKLYLPTEEELCREIDTGQRLIAETIRIEDETD
ncbi:MAG: PDDEXK nuclease domain-containing protein [Oscillospiraceae bacterium]|nr:PDDEXK nuclease domain-containing protein [Oscillospiraceae bacterium]